MIEYYEGIKTISGPESHRVRSNSLDLTDHRDYVDFATRIKIFQRKIAKVDIFSVTLKDDAFASGFHVVR